MGETIKVSDLLNEVVNGSVVLPDFQRSFIWEPEDVRELIVSVLAGYFIGSMLMLEQQLKDESPFALSLIEGVEKVNKHARMQSIVKILLDGQQRTTALFYALYKPEIPLKNRKSPYLFFLDLEKALEKQWNKAVISVSINDKRKLSEINKNDNAIPFSLLKDIGEVIDEFEGHPKYHEIIKLTNAFLSREIHMVSLPRDTDLETIVETFERINRTGEPLSVFELLTARLYKYEIKLRDLWESIEEKYNFAECIPPEFILKVISLLRGKEPKRKNILELDPQNFVEDWERACKSLETAFKRTTDIKNGYGVLDFKKWMPYTTMLVPLASMIDFITNGKLETKSNYDKINRWYWAAVFSNRYDQAVDTISANDFNAFKKWVAENGEAPDFIRDFEFDKVDLNTEKQSSAIYKGVISLIVLKGALDFKTGQPPQFGIEKIQDDHIFPKSVYNENCILNRTLISTNAEKTSKKPSEYFRKILEEHGIEKFKMILESHLIPEEAIDFLLNDDLQNFLEKRGSAILNELRNKIEE
ncbi:MAG: GmrSD restriction endonuclease domain-containing protein [bacterium]